MSTLTCTLHNAQLAEQVEHFREVLRSVLCMISSQMLCGHYDETYSARCTTQMADPRAHQINVGLGQVIADGQHDFIC